MTIARSGTPSGVLEPVLVDYPPPEAGIFVVRPPSEFARRKVRALIDILVERFGRGPRYPWRDPPARELGCRANRRRIRTIGSKAWPKQDLHGGCCAAPHLR